MRSVPVHLHADQPRRELCQPWLMWGHWLQGLASVTFGLICLSARLCLTVFLTQRRKSGRRVATAKEPERQPRLVRSLGLVPCDPVNSCEEHWLCMT